MIQHAFSKPSLVNLISEDTNLIFFYQFTVVTLFKLAIKTLLSSFVSIQCHSTSFKECNVLLT